jgi:dienelactone hydrolase
MMDVSNSGTTYLCAITGENMKVVSSGRWLATLISVLVLAPVLLDNSASADEPVSAVITRLKTPDGVEYGTWGVLAKKSAPTLFMLSGTIEGTLGEPYFRQCGNELAELGYLVVSIDLPCHGTQAIKGEPAGLSGWGHRVGNNEDIVAEANARLSKVLDHLIETGLTDPERVAAAGTSRGGFLAIHFAAHDPRVKCVAGFAPVTDLAALTEFRAKQEHPLVGKLSLRNQAEKLAGRPVWIIIGDVDERVGTHHAVELASRLSALAKEKKIASNVELHVMSEPRGHTTPKGASTLAADWVHGHLAETPQSTSQPAGTR